MAIENKRINTRILLKYDTYENWSTNNPNLLKGEMAIAVIDVSDNTQTHSGQTVPQLLVKIGNGLEGDAGKYNSLPFVSGLAADVHSWAKAASKPSYAINEISGAKEYQTIQGTDEYTWILQARKAQSSDAWENVSTIDLAKISTRIAAVEGRMTTAESDIDKLEGTVGDSTQGLVKDVADLKAAVGEGGSVADAITNAINTLDTPEGGVSQVAGADGLALNVVQENGVITSISGSIAANTYDAYGSAKAAVEALDATVSQTAGTDGLAVEITQVDGKLTGVTASIAANTYDAYGAASAAVEALDYTGATGEAEVQAGTEVKFIKQVTQENGTIAAELGSIQFQSALSADNKAATMADITGAVADLNGAMHFEGFTTTDPATGITIEGKPDYVAAAGDVVIYNTVEYVYDGSKWQKLGEEGALGAAIEALDATVSIEDEGNTNPLNITIVETNGVLTSVTGSIDDVFDAKGTAQGLINELDSSASQTAGADGLALNVVQENGKLTSISGSIKANTYDAYGAASAAVEALNLNEVAGTQTGTEIKFINKVSQTNGAVSAEVGTILVNTAYNAETNKIATMADITAAEGEVGEDIDALENRVKANEDAITTLNGTVDVAGSVAKSIQTAIEGLDKADTAVEGQFVTSVSEENGVITVARGAVNIKDVEQTANTYVVFDCGSSSVNV